MLFVERPRLAASRDLVAFRTWVGADGIVRGERAELAYVSLVSPLEDSPAARERWRARLQPEWASSGREDRESPRLLVVPIDLDVAADAPAVAVDVALRDAGVRISELQWQHDLRGHRVGRGSIVTLAAGLDAWMIDP
jgi:hypothetical protein